MTAERPTAPRDFSAAQLKLIRRTVARTCTDAEFDEFVAVASQCELDPLRRQITPLILNPDDQTKRRLICWATIDGLRVIAARQGDYRPMETAPLIEREQAQVDAERNPLGIVRAEVRAWKASVGVWHPVAGEAWWDEYAPLHEEWAVDDAGRRQPTGAKVLDPRWVRMGRVMIAKCAEAQALRRGWPDILSGLYGEEELQALKLADQTATELLRARESEQLRRQLGKRTLWLIFDASTGFQPVEFDQAAARLRAFYEGAQSLDALDLFGADNGAALQSYWQWAPAEAFALKELSEARRSLLQRQTGEGRSSSPQAQMMAEAAETAAAGDRS